MAVDINSREARALRKLIPLATLSKIHFAELCSDISIQTESEDYALFKQGNTENALIYLLAGEITLQADGYTYEKICAGSDAARFAIAHQIPRQINAIAANDIRFIRINQALIDNPPEQQAEEISYTVIDDSDENSGDWMTTILKSPIFQNLPAASLQKILLGFGQTKFKQGETIIKQGDHGDYFYLIKSGQCQIGRKPSPAAKDIKLGLLHGRDTFGEDALITSEPHNYSIAAISDVSLLRLDKEKFLTLITKPLLQYLDFDTAQQEVDNGASIIDVRLPDDFKQNHLSGSNNIPFFSLPMQFKSLNRKKNVIVVCNDGKLSEAAAFFLIKNKFASLILEGGLSKASHKMVRQKANFDIDDGITGIIDQTILPSPTQENLNVADTAKNADEYSEENEVTRLQVENSSLKQINQELTHQIVSLNKEKEQTEIKLTALSAQVKKLKGTQTLALPDTQTE